MVISKKGGFEMGKSAKAPILAFLVLAWLIVIWLANNWGVFAEETKEVLAERPGIFSAKAVNSSSIYYKDVEQGDWFYGAVAELTAADILQGYPDGTFKPGRIVTFGEFIRMMVMVKNGTLTENSADWAIDAYNHGLDRGLFTRWDIKAEDLAKPIPRKYMALILGSALGNRTIKDYTLLLETIKDVSPGDQFEFEMMKSYDAGLLKGYPDGRFAPDGRLTRAEAAAAVCRFFTYQAGESLPTNAQSDPADAYWTLDADYPAMEAWYNGSNISAHDDNIHWLENKQYKPQVRGRFSLAQGKLNFMDENPTGQNAGALSDEWAPAGATYKNINADIYKVLKAYWQIAAQGDYFITINGGRGNAYDTISIALSEKDAVNFPRTSSFAFNDGEPPLIGKVQPFIVFDLGMTYRLSQLQDLTSGKKLQAGQMDWRDVFLNRGRVLDQNLAAMHKNLLLAIYGESIGVQIHDLALENYGKQYEKQGENAFLKLIDLPNQETIIQGVGVRLDDDATARTTLYLGKFQE
jgi:hypothetical protein